MKNRKFWKIFLLALLTSAALTGGGVALYLYLTKKQEKKPITPPIDKIKEIKSKWQEFITSISKNNKLNDLSLTVFTNKNKWDDVLKAIREKLAIKFKEIFNNDSDLKIALQDEKGQPLVPENEIGLDYLDRKKIKIVLTYNKETSLTQTFEIDFKIVEHVSTKWQNFIKLISKNNKLNDLSLTVFTNKNKWDDVLKAIREKLVEEFYKVFGNKTDLLIELQDEKNQILDPKTDIGLDYLKDNKRIKIVLSHGKNKSLKNAFDIDLTITESPLTKFIKSLKDKKQLKDFYDLDNWAKLKAEIQKLIDNNSEFKDITIDPIDKNKDWEVGDNQTIDVKFKWKNYTSDAIKFNFNVIESPLTKFIKSLKDKKQLKDFYDLDNWAKLEAEIQKLIDNNSEFKDITIDPIDKNKDWEVGDNQTINVSFKQNDREVKKDFTFDFKVIESPLTKFIKSLKDKKQLKDFYDLDNWAKLEAEIQKLIDNNSEFKDITIDPIDKNKDWEVGDNQTINVSFKQNDREVKKDFTFDFKVIESPLTKFIKSLKDKKQLKDFYDLDNWAKLEAEIQKLIDNNSEFKDITIDPIDKNKDWEVGDNQTIDVKFKWKNYTSDAIKFNFNVIESPLTKFIKSLKDKKQLKDFYDLDNWAKLEAEIQKLIDNNSEFKDITIDPIDKNKDWEVGDNQTINVSFKQNDREVKKDFTFDFKVIESPLTKFIKSLKDKKQLKDFYDLDNWAKLEAEIQKLIDNNSEFKDITIDPIDKNKDWEVGDNQTINVSFKQNDREVKKDFTFDFKVIESPLTKFIKSLKDKKQLKDFYDLDNWAKLEAEIQKLIDNNSEFKDITIDPIDKNKDWEVGDNQTIDVKFKWKNYTSDAIKFNFNVIESPLTKFIKSLKDKKQLKDFYDLDNWAKLEAEIQKLIDNNSEFKDITIDPIDKNKDWEVGDNQTINVSFKQNDREVKKDFTFDFKVIESPLTKFIKSLKDKKQLKDFYDLDNWAKLEAEIQKLIDNNSEFKDITIDPIDKNKDWEVGDNQTINVSFKQNDREVKKDFTFDFKVIESPLTKFIKSLKDKKQLKDFYDLDNWAKLEAEIQKLIDNNSEFKDITIDPIDKNKDWEVGDNQTINVSFKQNDREVKKDFTFDFKVIESPLTKFIKSLKDKKQLKDFYDLDNWAKLEAEIQKLIDNNSEFKDITIDPIDKNKDWEVGDNQTINVSFKQNDREVKKDFTFDFKVIESPLTKFIKSLKDKKQLKDFYDLDNWAKLEAEIQKLIDNNSEFKDITIDPIDKNKDWEVGDNQTIDVKFKWKNYTSDAIKFNFKVIESPLTNFIKSLGDRTTWDEIFYDRDGLEKVKDKLASLLKGHPDIDYNITSEPKWELGKNKITIEFFDKNNSNHKQTKEFDFTIFDSPLTKFINSLGDKNFYYFNDLNNFSTIEASIQSIIDSSIFKDLITFEPIDKSKEWKVGNNQTLKVKFKQKKTSYEEEVEFKYNVVLSPFTKYLNNINNSSIGEITYNHNYIKNPNKFIKDYRELIKDFFRKNKLNGQIPDYEILTEDFDFESGTKNIEIKITYQGVIRDVTLKLVLKKLNLSEYEVKDLKIDLNINPNYDETAFEKSSINKREIIEKVIKALKGKVKDFKNIDIDEYMNYFDFKEFDNIYADFYDHTYTLDFISTLNKFVEGKIEVKLNVKKNSVRLNDLAKMFLEQLKKDNPELFKFEINNDYKFYFDLDGLKDFARLKAKYEELITKRMNEILYDDKYWLGKILKEQKITGEFEFDNFDISDNYEFTNTNFNMTMKYRGKNQTNKFTFKDTRIANLLKFEINTNEVQIETAKKFLDDLDKHKQTHKLTEGMMKEDKKQIDNKYSVTGLMNDDIDDWINIKKFIDNGFATNNIIKRKNLLNDYGFEWSRELSNTKNGYFFYSPNRNLVLNVKVNKYNNKGNYKDEPNEWSFSTGEISVKLYTLTNKNKLNGSWLPTEKKYDLINRAEWEWYAKFRSLLDNGNGHKNSLNFDKDTSWHYVIHKWLVHNMVYWPYFFDKFVTTISPGVVSPPKFSHFEDDHIVIKFAIEGKPIKSNYKHGYSYYLKLGGTGHIKKLRENYPNLFDDKYNFWDSLKKANLEKVDLKFRLYRTDDPHKTSEDSLLPIGKDVNYILA